MKRKLIFIAIAVVVLLGTAAGLYFSGMFSEAAPDPNAPPPPDERPYAYVPLKPVVMSFVEKKKRRYLQLSIQLVSRDEKTVELIEHNAPMIQAQALTLASLAGVEMLRSNEGKRDLIEQLKEATKQLSVFESYEIELDEVIITGFVEQ